MSSRQSDNLFQVDGYNLQRRDRDQHGGGLLILIKSDFPSGRKQYLESNKLENICYELYVNDQKWLIMDNIHKGWITTLFKTSWTFNQL
jgi:hypothetical protein